MAKSIGQIVAGYITSLQRTYSFSYNNFKGRQSPYFPALLTIGLVSCGLVGRLAWEDYRVFLSYGPGGMPYNVVGWLITNVLRVIGIDTLDVRALEADADKRTWLSAESLKARSGERPQLGRHPVPQRQLDQIPEKDVREVSNSSDMKLLFPQSWTGLLGSRCVRGAW